MTLGKENEFSSGWGTEATAEVETEAETWRLWVIWSIMMISHSSHHTNANAYRSKIIDRQRGNRTRDSKVVMGSLIDGGN